jgi:chaperonin GroES
MIKVTQEKVLVKFLEVAEKTVGGLYIPESAKEEIGRRVVLGEVVDINSKEKLDFKIGDTVIFKMYIADEIEEDGVKYGVLEIDDILALMK